mmetsp:Transcript_4803/g.20408  ORF Transcript_4803/g.20408 Transcript_4803/m.20408 type:complete len:237 (-) Transcript_4803:2618-3328(-)
MRTCKNLRYKPNRGRRVPVRVRSVQRERSSHWVVSDGAGDAVLARAPAAVRVSDSFSSPVESGATVGVARRAACTSAIRVSTSMLGPAERRKSSATSSSSSPSPSPSPQSSFMSPSAAAPLIMSPPPPWSMAMSMGSRPPPAHRGSMRAMPGSGSPPGAGMPAPSPAYDPPSKKRAPPPRGIGGYPCSRPRDASPPSDQRSRRCSTSISSRRVARSFSVIIAEGCICGFAPRALAS